MIRMRIDKLLSTQKGESRAEIKNNIKKYGVYINDVINKDPGKIIDTEKDKIFYRGEEIVYRQYIYLMLNKPAGYVSGVSDERDPTVVDLVKERYNYKDLFPFGRLDKDTEGLLIISNDGKLAHSLLSPKKHIPKKYFVVIKGVLSEDDLKNLKPV